MIQKLRPIIPALDVKDDDVALKFVDRLRNHVEIFKVGPWLFMRHGRRITRRINWRKKKLFLDLKFHDIPNTVEAAVRAAGEMGVYAVSVHLSGGEEMLKRVLALPKRPQVWGITMLTSIDQDAFLVMGGQSSITDQVLRLARIGAACGIDGIVCSPSEVGLLRKDGDIGGRGIALITPGIRTGTVVTGDDQKRSATPDEAIRQGADYIVIGRPILESADPGKTAAYINRTIKQII